MTDIFTHAVILQKMTENLSDIASKQTTKFINILDIGSGHGYLSFVLTAFMRKVALNHHNRFNYQITGIDTLPKTVEYCQKLQKLINF